MAAGLGGLRRMAAAPGLGVGLAAVVMLLGTGGSCSDPRREPTTPREPAELEEAELPTPALRLLVLTDLAGYLEPCGCTSRPLGGIDRMSARVRQLSDEGVPTLTVAAGNLFFSGAPHGAGSERGAAQERFKAETLADILGRIGLAAAAPGPLDFSYGTEAFVQLAQGSAFPLLAEGVEIAAAERAGTDDPASDDTASGGAASVDTASDDTASDDTASDEPASGDTASDEPASGGAASDDTASDDTASDDTASDDTASDDTASDGAASDDTASEEPASGDPDGASAGGPVLLGTALRAAGELQVGLLGAADLRGEDGSLPERVQAEQELRAVARRAAAELRERGADLVIALISADRRTARRLASGVEGVDFVVHGGVDRAEVHPPTSRGGTAVVNAGRQGQGLVVLDLWPRGDGGWTDLGRWTRQSAREHLSEQIESLSARIAQWEGSAEVDEADVARQRQRLERLQRQARRLARAPRADGNVFVARYEELAPDAERDPAITTLMERLDRRVNEHNRRVFADWTPEPAPPGRPHYVGSQACASCHGRAVQWWRSTPHGRAYATLEDRHKNYNLSCVGCHVTGYLEPGGSTVTHVDELQDVGCEVCHGPGSMHVRDPAEAAANVLRDPTESVCRTCHNPEHSDRFEFDVYRRMLIAPGHGAE